MKYIFTALIALFSFQLVSSQTLDTLFYKTFNDNSLASSLTGTSITYPGNIVKLIGSSGDIQYKINGTPALAVNPFACMYNQLMKGNTSSVYPVFSVVVNNSSTYDSLITTFKIKSRSFDGDLFSSSNSGFTISSPEISPVSLLLNFVEASGNVLQKRYELHPQGNLAFHNPALDLVSASAILSSSSPQVAEVYFRRKNTESNYTFNFSLTRPLSSTTLVHPSSGDSFTVSDNMLRDSIVNHFCRDAANTSDCKVNRNITYVYNGATEDYSHHSFVIDNILVAGAGSFLITSLLETEQNISHELKVEKVFSLSGIQVNPGTYSGIAVIVYSDGSRKKVFLK